MSNARSYAWSPPRTASWPASWRSCSSSAPRPSTRTSRRPWRPSRGSSNSELVRQGRRANCDEVQHRAVELLRTLDPGPVGATLDHCELGFGDESGQLLRLPDGNQDVAIAADHLNRHRQAAEPVASVVAADGVELACERLGRLGIRLLEEHPAQPVDRLLVLEELPAVVQEHQLVDPLLAAH